MENAPPIEWSLLAAPHRMLDVEARLPSARMEVAPGLVGQFWLAGERHRLLMVLPIRGPARRCRGLLTHPWVGSAVPAG